MKKLLAAVLAAAFVQPAAAITFPGLTTIYIGTGVIDDGSADNFGEATIFHCTNVSGVAAQVRFLVLGGMVPASRTVNVQHGETYTAATHPVAAYFEKADLNTGFVGEGAINIESTQSGVFCSAKSVSASAGFPDGVVLPLVRVNPHPGTVE
jgi:hypothetical protein